MKIKSPFPFLSLVFISSISFLSDEAFAQAGSQTWMEMMQNPSVNFYDVQKEFNKSLKKYEKQLKKEKSFTSADRLEKEMPGFMQYKRWEWFMEPRVYPSGDRTLVSKAMYDVQEKLFTNSSANKTNPSLMQSGNWSVLGPTSSIPTGDGGAGRINCFAIHPANPNIIFAASPAGGLWKTMDGGITWSTNTDHLAVMGISDIAIDPVNPNIMYLATGDGDGGDNYSIGVLKSLDGGNTWSATGFSFPVTQSMQMNRLIINPVNTNILFAATNLGIYRSLDSGMTWVRTLSSGGIKDLEFKPGNPNTVYASSISGFYRSVNGGTTFSTITSGLPSSSTNRMAIAVTPADTNYVYILAGKSSDNGFLGLYRSTNGGSSFTTQSTTPNVLGWNSNGGDSGGQSWYDLSIAASPTNKDEIVTGGVNIWRSTNGGVSWAINGHWTGSGAPYVHADIHALQYLPGSGTTVYVGCDGGFFKTTNNGGTWTDLSNGLQIAQMYKLGTSATNANVVIQGWQDNGTNKWNAGAWSRIYGGDGMECFIDWSNANIMYAELYYGDFKRSANGGATWSNIVNGITETGAWVTPWGIDPQNAQTLYAGFNNVWKSVNSGSSWSAISSISVGQIKSLAVAPSNPNYIYAASSNLIYKTTNGGTSWTNITSGITGGQAITYVAVSGNDPNRVWVTLSGYAPSYKVYKTTNGGGTWTNITYDLPNIPVNCIVADTSSATEGIYVGTDLCVYYIDSTRTSWLPFNNNLPNVIIDELEIQYSSGKLRAATYGRGLWESSLFPAGSGTPAANFSGNTLLGCPGMQVQFTDMSTNTPTSWNWNFPNGTPASSTVQNPLVTYTVAGTYNDVKLIATNASGSDSITKYSYIGISPALVPTTNPAGSVTICGTSQVINSSYGITYKWLPMGQTNNFMNASASGSYSVVVTDMFGCKDTSAAVNLTFFPAPATPTVTVNADTLTSSPAFSYQWYYNSAIISGSTSQTHVATQTGTYYVIITDANGCTKQSNSVIILFTGMAETDIAGLNMNITPSPNNGNFMLDISTAEPASFSVEILDVTGRMIYSRELGTVFGKLTEQFSLKLSKGIYSLSLKSKEGRSVQKFVVE